VVVVCNVPQVYSVGDVESEWDIFFNCTTSLQCLEQAGLSAIMVIIRKIRIILIRNKTSSNGAIVGYYCPIVEHGVPPFFAAASYLLERY